MRVLKLLTSFTVILCLQQIVTLWFLLDYFVTHESAAAGKLWQGDNDDTKLMIETISRKADKVRDEHCQDRTAKQTFDKVILIVIDALGSQFIQDLRHPDQSNRLNEQSLDTMPFVSKSLRTHTALGFIARAMTPTVTMPRIKSLLSGTIPSFADIAFNLAGDVSKFDVDNLVSLARMRDKTLVFYGDDTWLSLFDRSMFKRSEETLSFFASDYTSVDTNVTSNAIPETQRESLDWDWLILHYLGLDHIGHAFGSNRHKLIGPKLIEMDEVVKKLYENMSDKHSEHNTLLIICGDHGMRADGNHGGDNPYEIDTALIFMPITNDIRTGKHRLVDHKHNNTVDQIDIAVTLAMILDYPIPSRSKGAAIESLLHSLWLGKEPQSLSAHRVLACSALDNLIQLIKHDDLEQLFGKKSESAEDLANSIDKMLQELESISSLKMTDDIANITEECFKLTQRIKRGLVTRISMPTGSVIVVVAIVIVCMLTIVSHRRRLKFFLNDMMSSLHQVMALAMLALPIVMLGSTDYIEGESRMSLLIALGAFALTIALNQFLLEIRPSQFFRTTEDKVRCCLFIVASSCMSFAVWPSNEFSEAKDTSRDDNTFLPILSLMFLYNSMRSNCDLPKPMKHAFLLSLGIIIWCEKYYNDKLPANNARDSSEYFIDRIVMQRIIILVLAIYTCLNLYFGPRQGVKAYRPLHTDHVGTSRNNEEDIHAGTSTALRKLASSWACLAFALVRRHNMFMVMQNMLMEVSVNHLLNISQLKAPVVRTLLYVLFAHMSFYSLGNTNLFSTLDVKVASFGMSSYSLIMSAVVVAITTYSTSIYWYLKLFQRVQQRSKAGDDLPISTDIRLHKSRSTHEAARERVKNVAGIVIERNFLSIGYYMIVCYVLRHHLFVWSVLSPKLLYHYVETTVSLSTALMSVHGIILLQNVIDKLRERWQHNRIQAD